MLRTLEQKVHAAWTAVLVVDMQNEFLSEGGLSHHLGSDLSRGRRAADTCRRFLDDARATGVKVVHLRSIGNREYLNEPMLELAERKGLPPYCIEGSYGAQFFEGFDPGEGEPVVTKHRHDGFYETNLHTLLQQMGIRTVLVTGVTTSGCVDVTAREAYFRGYYVIVVRDCTGGPSAQAEEMTLQTIGRAYGEVVSADDIAKLWRTTQPHEPAGVR